MRKTAPLAALLCTLTATPALADYALLASLPDATGDHLTHPGGNPLLLNGKIYLTGIDGGTSHSGAIGYYDPATNAFTTLYSFPFSNSGNLPYSGLLQIGDAFYGTTKSGTGAASNGVVWRINTDGTGFQQLHAFTTGDGNFTTSGLVVQNAVLYGVTGNGAAFSGRLQLPDTAYVQ